jgi:bifunctional non-homologous end joining protein LigD
VAPASASRVAVELFRRLEAMRIPKSPFARRLARVDARDVVFVRSELVAEVEFRGWSADGLVRQSSFSELREDKRPEEVLKESAEEHVSTFA